MCRRPGHRRHRDRSGRAVDGDGAAITRSIHRLDAGRGARRQKPGERFPVIRRAIGEPEPVTTGLGERPPGEAAELGRRSRVGAANLAVEAAQAAEAGGDRDLRKRQARFVEQLLGGLHAAGQRHLDGRRAEMLHEQPAQVTRGHAEPIGEHIDALPIERAVADQPQRPRHHARGAEPRRRAGRGFRAAAQARSEAGRFSGGRSWVIADVVIVR